MTNQAPCGFCGYIGYHKPGCITGKAGPPPRQVTVEPTSLAAYRTAKATGVIGRSQAIVLEAIRQHGPITGRELDSTLATPADRAPSYHKRTSELERKGLIAVAVVRRCRSSGKMAKAYVVAGGGTP